MRRLPKSLLAVFAILFGAATVMYTALWTVYGNRGIPVELGFETDYVPSEHGFAVKTVYPESPAERAGLRVGDLIVGLYGAPTLHADAITSTWARHHSGDAIDLTIHRPGNASPILLHAIFRSTAGNPAESGVARALGAGILHLYPWVFLIVGLTVLFLRLEDRNAWLLALMFSGFITIPDFSTAYYTIPTPLQQFAIVYRTTFDTLVTYLFYFFFAVFPVRSPVDRRLPWLKWVGLALGLMFVPSVYPRSLGNLNWLQGQEIHLVRSSFSYIMVGLGLLSLIWNRIVVESPEARRKMRVIVAGTIVGVLPPTVALAIAEFGHHSIGLLLGTVLVILLWLFPLSFAYAVVKHRVLEIPILLRRSARYLLVQRGFALLLVGVSAGFTVVFALIFSRYLQSLTAAAVPGGIALGTVFGSALLWTGTRVHKNVGHRIDRAFFRSSYDTRVVMEQLLEETRSATDRKELAVLLEQHLKEALHPSSVLVFLETSDNQLTALSTDTSQHCKSISPLEPGFAELANSGKPWDVPAHDSSTVPLPEPLLQVTADCVVPIVGRGQRLVGLILLGARLSEEPYAGEDKRLLALIANQVAVVIESISLGEKIAERLEADRRTNQEMEFARQVQARLLPQKLPAMRSLEYVGGCLPARQVGGDYYDFLELRPQRLGIALADIAGKGVPGALLMANLQANLRSQYAMAVEDLPRLLASVNRLFFENTDDNSYATLFFGDYDDGTGVLRYANCGHLSPLLLRAHKLSSGNEWLQSTCTVLGLFEKWQSEIVEVRLDPGDTLVLYTDGVTEAVNEEGEEFGQERLLRSVMAQHQLSVAEMMKFIFEEVRRFSHGEQQDDITLVIARRVQ